MGHVYSVYEAKAKFSEVIRKVRAGQRIVITYRGDEIAHVLPVQSKVLSIEESLQRLEDEGVLSRAKTPAGRLKPIVKRPGALARFLESREFSGVSQLKGSTQRRKDAMTQSR